MKSTLKRSLVVYILIALFLCGMAVFLVSLAANAETWAMYPANKHIYENGKLMNAGTITDAAGKVLAQSKDGKRIYSSNSLTRKALLHTVGDTEMFIANSVQKEYRTDLLGYNIIDGVYNDNGEMGSEVRLTVYGDVCAAALEALAGRKGAVSVCNYKTGEMICMVSSPTFDPQNKPKIEDDPATYDGVYVNRVLSGLYPPGSVFKVITLAAAIEKIPGVMDETFDCDGAYHASDGTVTCTGKHGKQTLEQALANSCNSAFGELANRVGADALQKQAEKMGCGETFQMDRIKTLPGSINLSGADNADLAWAGIGQYTTLVTPFQMMVMMGAVANDGKPVEPYLVAEKMSFFGLRLPKSRTQTGSAMMKSTTASTLQEYLRNDVVSVYGDQNFPGLTLCAKSGTAEVGGDQKPHSWFAGYNMDEKYPFAFAVVIENGGYGTRAAAPVASTVLRKAVGSVPASESK